MLRTNVCLYLCGSGLSITDAIRMLQSKVAKITLEPEKFVSFGGFDDYESFQTFVRLFVGIDKIGDQSLKNAFIWLRGRFRFTTTYLEYILKGFDHTTALYTMQYMIANI